MSDRESLLSQKSILQQLFENSGAAIALMDYSGNILVVNHRFEQITGYSKKEVEKKKSWKDFAIEEDYEELSGYLKLLRVTQEEVQEKLEIRFRSKEDTVKTCYIGGFMFSGEKLIALSFIDITDQKEYEHELEIAKESAENSERLKTAFLANMSHEIRTPINSIVGFSDLLKTEKIDEEKRNLYLSQVVNSSNDLLRLIEKIISISRLDSGQVKINNREFDLNDRLNDLYIRYQEELNSIGRSNIDLKYVPGIKEDSYIVVGDSIRLSEVLSNLLENAIKFTDEGRIEFGYYYLDADIDDPESSSLLFYVKDSGSGIDKDKKKVIFDRFVKVIEKEEKIYKGAGLGLTIAREIVDLMGGKIWVESTKGSGSRFFFNYPLSIVKQRENVSSNFDRIERGGQMEWSGKDILIAEDVESNYLYVKEILAPTKVNILRARDGIEALDVFKNTSKIDLIIMDILMPGMDGYEATKEIRKLNPDIPVVAQSAFTFEGDMQDGLYAGCFDDYILKPYTRKVLFAILNKYFTAG